MAVAPPRSTPNMSRAIAARIAFAFHTNRNPAENDQTDSGSRIARERRDEDALAVIGVDEVSGKQHKKDLWEKLDQTRVTQIHRRMRTLVDFPADSDLLHLPAEDEDHVAGKIAAERR